MSSPQKLLRELVAIPSVSNLSNRPLVEWIERYLKPLGWYTRLFCYHDAAGVEKLNLIVSPWPMETDKIVAELAIVCHTDTVPYSSEWQDATELREQDRMLHGCGACDVKGFLACMLGAVSDLDLTTLKHRLCLVFTADEEVGCRGARFLLEQNALSARYAIVGEPTSLIPARAGKGYCLAKVHVRGVAAHSAYPEAGKSAIFAAAHLLGAIEALGQEMTSLRNEAFSPPWTTLNVGEIHGGTAKNIIPADCWFLVEWRPIPGQRPELVLERLRGLVGSTSSVRENGSDIEIEVLRLDQGFETDRDSPLIRSVQGSDGAHVATIAFGTEAPWMEKMGAEAVVIGPGSMLTAHSSSECVPSLELDACVQLLHAAIQRICA